MAGEEAQSDIREPFPGYWRPKANIQALLLSQNTLAVIVSGYGMQLRPATDSPIIQGYLETQIRLYDTTQLGTTGELPLLGVQNVHGYLSKGYLFNGIAHITTQSSVNTYDQLLYPVQYWHPDNQGLTPDEYEAKVMENAEEYAQEFASKLLQELSASTGVMPKTARMTVMSEGSSEGAGFENQFYSGGYGNSMYQITSFHMDDALTDPPEDDGPPTLQVKQTVKFMPSWWGLDYSAGDTIIVAAQGTAWNTLRVSPEQRTMLFGFSLVDLDSTPTYSGSVPGTLISDYSIDYVDGRIRVATTERHSWWGGPVLWVDDVLVDSAVADSATVSNPVSNVFATGEEPELLEDSDEPFPISPPIGVIDETGEGGENQFFEFVLECPPMPDPDAGIDEECMGDIETCEEYLVECDNVFYNPNECPYKYHCSNDYYDTGCPLKPVDECLTISQWDYCNREARQRCVDFVVAESCPYAEVRCAEYDGGGQPGAEPEPDVEGRCPEITEPCMNERNHAECIEIAQSCELIAIGESCPLQFFCDDAPPPPTESPASTTTNHLIVLEPDDNNMLQVVGNTTLGEKDEGVFIWYLDRSRFHATELLTLSHLSLSSSFSLYRSQLLRRICIPRDLPSDRPVLCCKVPG